MKKIRHKHPLAIRWFHWLNFPILLAMAWSGLLIYWANDIYKLGWGDKTLLKFFPQSFYDAWKIPYRLAEGMNIHFFFMWLFALNGFLYVGYLFLSGEWRVLFPDKKSWKDMGLLMLNSLRISRKKPAQGKFNAAQRIVYTGVILLGFIMLLNGLAIYKPVQLHWLCALFGGYENARAIHFIITILFVLFFLVHIIQVVLHGWNNFRAMITGFEVVKETDESAPSAMREQAEIIPLKKQP